ncbi:hypothetical protein HHK36_000520 [Tetracentron sinense]|uniref:Uncharacterized protein n=1 Tax=Tetracentron sinense TaxID=13715 RepID=A0A835A1T6_TETSI|nr:hypothetical protein HHK36_000520 [Tetracentron sinense]
MFVDGLSTQTQLQACPSSLSSGDSRTGIVFGSEVHQDSQDLDVVSSVMSRFDNLSLDEKLDDGVIDKKNVIIMNLESQIRVLKERVKEEKEWAKEKEIQATRKVSGDLTELKELRMERDLEELEMSRMKREKAQRLKRLSKADNDLRKASGQMELEAKEMAMTQLQLQEEQRSKDASEIQELYFLKVLEETKTDIHQKGAAARMLHELKRVKDSSEEKANCKRKCLICMENIVSVVFLPCVHQILCDIYNGDSNEWANASLVGSRSRIQSMFVVRVHSFR